MLTLDDLVLLLESEKIGAKVFAEIQKSRGVPMNVVALLDGLDEAQVEQNDDGGAPPPPKSSHVGVIPLLPLSYKMNFDSAMDTMTNRRFRRGF